MERSGQYRLGGVGRSQRSQVKKTVPSGLRLDLATLQMKSELDSAVTRNQTGKPRYGSVNPEDSGGTKNTLRMGDIRELLEKDTKQVTINENIEPSYSTIPTNRYE